MQEAARELGIDSGRITKWRQSHKSPGQFATAATGLSEEQMLIKQLQKELKEAQLERDILKTGAPVRGRSASSPGETGNIPIYNGTRQAVSR